MKYAVRTTRNTFTGEISVYPVVRVRNSAHPYRIKYTEVGTAERLQIFDTKDEALAAKQYEEFAAEYALKSQAELLALLKNAVREYREEWGIPLTSACRLTNAPRDSMRAFLAEINPCNPRVVAKFVLGLDIIREASRRASAALPDARKLPGT